MTLALIGRKLGMSQCFDENGVLVPVTLVEAGPCRILQKKIADTDGYNALQLGFGERSRKWIDRHRALKGHLAKTDTKSARWIREVRVPDPDSYEVGQVLDIDIFEDGDLVDVVGRSKGHGFTGVIKRHNQHRGPETHGSNYHRKPGSMGPSAYPARVFKGKNLPGQMGNARVTAMNLKIVKRDKEKNLIALKGSIPGAVNGMVIVRKAVKAKKNKH